MVNTSQRTATLNHETAHAITIPPITLADTARIEQVMSICIVYCWWRSAFGCLVSGRFQTSS